MGVVHLSAHLRRMHDAVFGAAPRGAVLLGNARSPITCSAPGTACATRRPRARANRPVPNGARRRTCHAPPVLARNQKVLRRNHRRCQQRQGLGVRSGREAHCRLQLPHPGAGQRRHVHAVHRGPRRMRGRAGGRSPPGSWPFFVPSDPSPLARVPKGMGQTHAPRPPRVIRPRASVPYLLVNAQGRIRCSALALRPSRQCKSSTRMRLPPACPACTRCAISDWFRLRATRPRAQ